ncbi:MAG: hypothetical protein A2622_08645 [Bdellovibrionales bacterium RIFCSPHIGHO2_01_FULL_40_29]|nr:MAG: hypothetical protein A2622_08645 [Bdellovibrionales bacterium RIFCSPHIGHO2_01_FULL_40_29]OFZ35556.1 MAG: hypothetical protein A3D17_07880 [Bdellovibrionales bacterium RIFCSPHIGHO2_02_FULL_40_15]
MKNKKGQALIEAMLLMIIVTISGFKVFQLGLSLISEIIIENSLETALLCQFQENTNCVGKLKSSLQQMNLKSIRITDHSRPETARLRVQWSLDGESFHTLESELHLDLQVP